MATTDTTGGSMQTLARAHDTIPCPPPIFEPPPSGVRLRVVLTPDDAIEQCRASVRHLAKRFARQGIESDDLEQEGYFAVLQALPRWEPDRGVSFSHYAGRCVRFHLTGYVRTMRRRGMIGKRAPLDAGVSFDAEEDDGSSLHERIGRSPSPEDMIEILRERPAKSKLRLITHEGRTQCLAEWAREIGISKEALHSRFAAGWTTKRALTSSLDTRRARKGIARRTDDCAQPSP
jgi:RNA polymerase sigma factor (sigma-70 family)